MIRYLFALILSAGAIYVAILYESTAFALLGFTLLFLMILSVGYLFYEKKSLQVTMNTLPALADRQTPIFVSARTTYRYRGCYGRIMVQAAISREGHRIRRCKWLREEYEKLVREKETSPEERNFSALLSFAQAGSYVIWLRKIRIYDLTGLFCVEQRRAVGGERAVLAVLPPVYLIRIQLSEAVRSFAGDAEVYDSLRSGQDSSELLQLRPFQNGDKLRNIHWKLSAKADELLVRESSRPRGCPVVVLAETAGSFQETRLQCAASLSFCLMDLDCPHYVAWYGSYQQDVVRMRVDDEESFYEAFLYLLREEGRNRVSSMDLQARYREKYNGEPVLHHIRVTAGPCICVDEQEAVSLQASALERELAKLELLL